MKSNFWLFLLVTAATEEGLLGGRETIFSRFPPSSWPSSSSSERPGGICLNGGTSVPSLSSGRHMFCLCADGFQGTRCETAKSSECYEGVGLYYRGSASTAAGGLPCETWDAASRTFLSSDEDGGRHNHCRNLQYRMRPWCFVRKQLQLQWEYCDIPRCGAQPLPGPGPAGPGPAAPGPADPGPADPGPADPGPAGPGPGPAAPGLSGPGPAPPTSSDPGPGCGLRSITRQMKIVGGSVAPVENQPWVAAIFFRRGGQKAFLCGGSLIHPCWVLSAAHCFPRGIQKKPWRFSVSLGRTALNESNPEEQNFRVEEVIVHHHFDHRQGDFNHDIALLKLRSRRGRCAEENQSVRTVCLPPPFQKLLPGTTCEVAGYGKEQHGLWYRSQYLREVQVDLVSDSVCRQEDHYGDQISENMFCAGSSDWSRDACEGDSGGPLVCSVAGRVFLFGVVSWGHGCARTLKPGVYTSVTNYNHWVELKTAVPHIAAGTMFPQK